MDAMISVIIPIYNSSEWIDKCLDSITKQIYKNIEILLAIGKCEDDSLEKCLQWQKKDSRIIIIGRKDNGQGDARNYAMKVAKGKYISFVDADDWVDNDYLLRLVSPLESDDEIDVSCCGVYDSDGMKEYLPVFNGKTQVSFEMIAIRTWSTIWIYLYRRDWLRNKKIEMYSGCHEDDAWRLILAAELTYVFFVRKALYHYNYYNIGSTMLNNANRRNIVPALFFAFEELKKRNYFDQYRNILRKYFIDTWNTNYNFSEHDDAMEEVEMRLLDTFFPEVVEERMTTTRLPVRLENKLIVVGAGGDAHCMLSKHYEPTPAYIIDNDKKKHGTMCEGIEVKSYDDLLKEEKPYTVIVSTSKYYYELTKKLRNNGINNILPVDEYPLAYIFDGKQSIRRIIIFYVHESDKIEDCIVAESQKNFISRYIPDYDVVEISDEIFRRNGRRLGKYIKDTDIIAFSGGNSLGSHELNAGEKALRVIVKRFPHNKIVILPQTIFYSDDEYGNCVYNDTLHILKKANSLYICTKDKMTYKRMLPLASNNIHVFLLPDLALLFHIGTSNTNRNDRIAVYLQDGKNSILTDDDKGIMCDKIFDMGRDVIKINMKYNDLYERPVRRASSCYAVLDKMNEVAKYSLVVTDDFYCAVLCAITLTPCLLINAANHDIAGLYDWLSEMQYIKFLDSISNVQVFLAELLELGHSNCKYSFDYKDYSKTLINIIKETIN